MLFLVMTLGCGEPGEAPKTPDAPAPAPAPEAPPPAPAAMPAATMPAGWTDCMDKEADTRMGNCTGPREADAGATPATSEATAACAASSTTMFSGKKPDPTTIYWHVCGPAGADGQPARADCKCAGSLMRVPEPVERDAD
jgi:hypothetical protein